MEKELLVSRLTSLIDAKDYRALKKLLNQVFPSDLALAFDELREDQIFLCFRLLDKDNAADTFVELDSDLQEAVIKSMSDKELKSVVDELFVDDMADIIGEMPANVVKRILKQTDSDTRETVNHILQFNENSAGAIMTTEFVSLKKGMTVKEAFDKVRKTGIDKETIYTCYVTDTTRKLVGVITAKRIMTASKDALIGELMEENVISVETSDDKEDVAQLFSKYGFLALPVVDKEKRLVGIVTVDDAIDVLEEEAEEDFSLMAGVLPAEKGYLDENIVTHWKNRIIWLLILMISGIISGYVITSYEQLLLAIPALVAFVPRLMGTNGNEGSQSSTLIIRALSTNEISTSDFWKVLLKEISVGLLIGTTLAVANIPVLFIQYGSVNSTEILHLCLVYGITFIITSVIASALGAIMPMAAEKMKLDPALIAAPLITTILDVCSILICFEIAKLLFAVLL